MGESTSHQDWQPPSPAAIETLPNDPEALQALWREQTDMGRFHEQLQQFHRLQGLGALAEGIVHEFNNILAAMLGFTEITLPLLPTDSPAQHNLQSVYTAGQRARAIIRQTLNYSRAATTVSQPWDYAPMVTEVLGLLRASLPKTVEIREEIASDVGAILADPASMQQLLINLCTNAAHALEAPGFVDVKVDICPRDEALAAQHPSLPPGDYIRLRVQDNGCGVPPESLDRIFDPFFTTKASTKGMGLGLTIVNRIVATYQGAIAVESTLGNGTTFTVYLPHASASTSTVSQAETRIAQGKGNFLLVDDEIMLAQVSKHLLERLGYTVEVYTSSKEAVERFRQAPHHYDLVITDLTMPEMNGVQLITVLKVIRPNIQIILCTGFGHTLDEETLEALGVNALLLKPIETPELAETVQQVLQSREPSQ